MRARYRHQLRFSPATVIPVNGTASTALTVTTSASVSRYGLLTPELFGVCDYFLALSLLSLAILCAGKLQNDNRPSIVAAAASLTIVVLVLAIGGCGGGGYGSSTQPNRGTASIMVTAQSAEHHPHVNCQRHRAVAWHTADD